MENTVEEVEAPVEEVKKAKKPRTKAVAEETPVENVSIQESVVENDEGQKVISGPKRNRAPRKSNTRVNEDGVIGSNAADYALKDAPKANAPVVKATPNPEKTALWSAKNIRWTGVGELSKGYNIVTKEAADKWLKKDGIREATPEEVATYYGK
jgi:hypothetical protein